VNSAPEPLWQPSERDVQNSNLTRFLHAAERVSGRAFTSYDALHEWSVTQPDAFWQTLWDFTEVAATRRASLPLLDGEQFPGARWFHDAELNFAENLLRFRDERPAIVSYLETGARSELSFSELYRQVAALVPALRALGVGPGVRAAAWLPNTAQTIVAMLATSALGGVWSSCSPDFGVEGALDRFGQIEPAVLFACDGYTYNGKFIDTRDKVASIVQRVPAIRQVLWVDVLGLETEGPTLTEVSDTTVTEVEFTPMPFNAPLYILYSSGTTGKPKCIVHGAGGTLLQHLKEHRLHTGLVRDDRLFFFTTCGWMMWNWLVSALASGCCIVLYDGSPFHPHPGVLWDMAEREQITVFGISAKYLSGIEKNEIRPAETHNLDALRMLVSTGSPLIHEGFHYVYRDIKADMHLVSMSGGTDIVSCFVLGNPNQGVFEGEIQSPGLGMAVDVWDEDGNPLRGEKGELVCTRPFPSCPIGFWNDDHDARFRASYFERFPGIWAHGDFAEITPNGGYIIHGRSDAVLNPGGVRIGTAEIYRQVETIEVVAEAVCVGQEWDGDTRVVLFVVMQPGTVLTDTIRQEIRSRIRSHASPRHVPAVILSVDDIPRTMSGKIAELAVRDVIHARPVKNTSALANPEALACYEDLPELMS
jgi:acetoacetyl-CoA synthetase